MRDVHIAAAVIRDASRLLMVRQGERFDQAVEQLTRISWQSLTMRHLRGELERGSLWLQRVQPDGHEEWLAVYGAAVCSRRVPATRERQSTRAV